MRLRRLCLPITCALFAALLSAGCDGNSEDKNPLRINPEKDIHGLYQKVLKEKERTAKPREKRNEAEPRESNQPGSGDDRNKSQGR